MRIEGTLAKWNDDRGFGFIAPTLGGPEVFVHVSAFPRDGRQPAVGERLSFDIEMREDGKKRAVRIQRLTLRQANRASARVTPARPGLIRRVLPVLFMGVVGYAAYIQWGHRLFGASAPSETVTQNSPLPTASAPTPEPEFHCDGRQHCSQMRSCAEARYFLRHCPGVKMDGDNDGIPCENQWC